MIIKRDESEVAVLGEVQKYKVSIDERNINHIVTILSSNLYSHPMSSFLRETVSNAIDSHKEAGVDEPIIITITDKDIAIRDFGTGISPERFEQIYINIGSSTKRESNEYIGSFGLGRFSCLSVSDLANVTSFYNGKAYYYVMNKDIDQLHIDLLFEKDTDEQNGVEVKIPYTDKIAPDDLRCLTFIKNIYIEDKRRSLYYNTSDTEDFNKRKIHAYKTFKTCIVNGRFSSYTDRFGVLVGDILYPVDYSQIASDTVNDSWKDTFNTVRPCVEIGSVDVTPNREELLYSERTKRALTKAFEATIAELTEYWNIQCSSEKKDFIEFADDICNHYYNILHLDEDVIDLSRRLPYNFKYNGFEGFPSKDVRLIVQTFYNRFVNGFLVYDGSSVRRGESYTKLRISQLFDRARDGWKIIAAPSYAGFSGKYIDGFIRETYGFNKVFITHQIKPTLRWIKALHREHCGTLCATSMTPIFFKVIRELSNLYKKYVEEKDIIGSEEYQQYKKDNREVSSFQNMKDKSEYIFHIYNGGTLEEKYTGTVDMLIRKLKWSNRKLRIVYAPLNSPFTTSLMRLKYPNLCVVELAKGAYKLAEKGLFPKWVKPVESIYSPTDKHLCRYATIQYLRSQGYVSESYFYMIPQDIVEDFKYLNRMSEKYSPGSSMDRSILDIVPEENYDKQIIGAYKRVKSYIDLINSCYGYNSDLFWYKLIKSKKIRLDLKCCAKLLREKIRPIEEIISKL